MKFLIFFHLCTVLSPQIIAAIAITGSPAYRFAGTTNIGRSSLLPPAQNSKFITGHWAHKHRVLGRADPRSQKNWQRSDRRPKIHIRAIAEKLATEGMAGL
ncbi:MAG: hypothetical protein F6J93_12115 [Oscillatoria sp. SIO1A7]|nr:hypothetical protein [Oscillatoria sp. SIO1A7]